MKKLLTALILLTSISSFAYEVEEGSRIIYLNIFRRAIVGTVQYIDGNELHINIDNDLATGRVFKSNIIAVGASNCKDGNFCVGDTYREYIEGDEYNIGEVEEVFTNGWRVVKNDNSWFENIVHIGNLEKL